MDAQRIEDAFDTSEHREKLSGRNLGAFVLDDPDAVEGIVP